MYHYAYMLEKGEGISADFEEAIKYYILASNKAMKKLSK